MTLEKKELYVITGGGWSLTSFSNFTSMMGKIYDFGRTVGSNLYRYRHRFSC